MDVNSEEMERCIQELRTKKRNIYSLGVIENKFELSMANLYVHEDFMFFIFDLKNKSYIDYDIEFVKCFQRDQKEEQERHPARNDHRTYLSEKILNTMCIP